MASYKWRQTVVIERLGIIVFSVWPHVSNIENSTLEMSFTLPFPHPTPTLPSKSAPHAGSGRLLSPSIHPLVSIAHFSSKPPNKKKGLLQNPSPLLSPYSPILHTTRLPVSLSFIIFYHQQITFFFITAQLNMLNINFGANFKLHNKHIQVNDYKKEKKPVMFCKSYW